MSQVASTHAGEGARLADDAATRGGAGEIVLRLALLLLVGLAVSNAFTVPALTGKPVYQGVLAVATAAAAYGVASGRRRLRLSGVVLLYGLAVLAMIPSVVESSDPAVAWTALLEFVKDLWFLTLVVLLGSVRGGARAVVRTTVVVMSAIGALALVNQFVLGQSTAFGGFAVISQAGGEGTALARQQGPFDDINFFGRLLAMVFPLGLALALDAWNRRERRETAFWGLCELSLLGGLYLTGSRGAMLALAVGVAVWMVLSGRGTRRALWVLPVLVLLALLAPGVGSRLGTLGQLSPDTDSFSARDGALVERLAAQEVALAMFQDNPVVGVGPAVTDLVFQRYASAGGEAITRQVAPHNLFLQLLAESGLVGFLGWLVFMVGVVLAGSRVLRWNPAMPGAPPSFDRLLASASIAGLLAWGVAGMFLHLALFRPVLVVVALVGMLSYLTRPVTLVARPAARSRRRPIALLTAIAVAVTCLALTAATVKVLRVEVWRADVPVSLVAVASEAESDPQSYDYRVYVTKRRRVVATYAKLFQKIGEPVMSGEDSTLSVVAPRASSGSFVEPLFLVRIEGRHRGKVADLAREVAQRGAQFVVDTPDLAGFAVTRPGKTTTTSTTRWKVD